MSTVERVKNKNVASPTAAKSESGARNGRAVTPNGAEAPAEMEGLDELEQEIVLQLEKEFGDKETAASAVKEAPAMPVARPAAPPTAPVSDIDASTRLLEIRRKRDLSTTMEEQIRDGASLFSTLAKQAGTLSEYLDKTEAELKRLERIESSSTKLRIASEGLIRNNHEMKGTIEEQRKKVALLESKIASLRDANEAARTNLARLVEEKRTMSVDLSSAQSEVARLENDKRTLTERSERHEEENRELKASLAQAKDRERTVAIETRKHEDDLARKNAEIEELRDRKTQAAIEIEELKSRNAALETLTVEQRSRIEELTFEMKSSRKEMEEIVRLKQQRILELESRNMELGINRQEFDETMMPSLALDDDDEVEQIAPAPAKPRAKAPAKPAAKGKTAPKGASKANAKSEARQPVKAG
jgi:hypothetical protein